MLLDSIPTMFQSNRTADSAFGAAVKVCAVVHLMFSFIFLYLFSIFAQLFSYWLEFAGGGEVHHIQ